MTVAEGLIDSWDRQAEVVAAIAGLVDAETRSWRPTDDGMSLDEQLVHIHQVRKYWLTQFSPRVGREVPGSVDDDASIADLDEIRRRLNLSAAAVRDAVASRLSDPLQPSFAYENPVLFLQHMVWHEGWHVGLIMTALRTHGKEPPEEWEESNLWGRFRTEIWPPPTED